MAPNFVNRCLSESLAAVLFAIVLNLIIENGKLFMPIRSCLKKTGFPIDIRIMKATSRNTAKATRPRQRRVQILPNAVQAPLTAFKRTSLPHAAPVCHISRDSQLKE